METATLRSLLDFAVWALERRFDGGVHSAYSRCRSEFAFCYPGLERIELAALGSRGTDRHGGLRASGRIHRPIGTIVAAGDLASPVRRGSRRGCLRDPAVFWVRPVAAVGDLRCGRRLLSDRAAAGSFGT